MQSLVETGLSNALVASLLALAAFAVSRWRRPALAHGLWLLVLVKLVTPPLVPIYLPPLHLAEAEPVAPASAEASPPRVRLATVSPEELAAALAWIENHPAAETTETAETPVPASSAPAWWECLVPVWLGGAGVWLVWSCWSVARFERLLRSAWRAPVPIQDETRRLAARLGLAKPPQVWLVPGVVSPMIWAIGAAPRLLFPTGLLDRLDGEQRAALLLHELAHVRRRDHWVRFVELLVVTLYWWHPVVWWARRELREAEEQCCDAWVVWASGGDGHAYARALLEAVAFVSRTRCPLPAMASGVGHIYHLRRRLTMIVRANTPKSLSAAGWLVLAGVGLLLLPLAAQAQVPAKKGEDDRDREIKILKEKLRALEEKAGLPDQIVVLDDLADLSAVADLEIVLDDDNTTDAVAQLKREIAAKRAELKALEKKLEMILAGMEGKKAGKAKAEGAKAKLKGLNLKDGIQIELINEKAVKEADEALQKEMKKLKEQLKQLPKGAIQIELMDEKGVKKLGEAIEKAIKVNPDLKHLEELKKLKDLRLELDNKKLDELKKLGIDIEIKTLDGVKKQLGNIELKSLDEVKKQLDNVKALNEKQLREFKKAMDVKQAERDKAGTRKTQDIDARLDRLMKEIEALRREIHQDKGKPK